MIKVENVNKKLNKKEVLKNINLHFEKGKIYGVFGKNGSGKTMLLRSIAGLITSSEGFIEINENRLHRDISFPPSVGVIIESMEMLSQFNAFKNLKIVAGINNIVSDKHIKETIKAVGLDPDSKLKVKHFSLGMKQRLNIAQAILEDPEILLLDEPTNAIDEEGIDEVKHILLKQKEKGTTIIIATHHKEEFQHFCDDTIKMVNGEIADE